MFKKDILIVDIEATGVDIHRHEIIQLAAVLLDKKTLRTKKRFNSYIKPSKWKNRDPEAMKVCQISWGQLKDAPTLKSVLQKFNRTFGHDVMLANYGGNLDFIFLPEHYRKAGLRYRFDYHTLNIWALGYLYMAERRRLTNRKRFAGFSLEDLAEQLGIPLPTSRHDALVDCIIEAEILRQLVKELKS